MRVAAVVLTAGRSQRMGCAKAWLLLEGEPFLVRVTRIAADTGADPIVVVAGAERGDALVSREHIQERLTVTAEVAIGAPDGHPIDSLRAGLTFVPEDCAVLLWPVDHPFADATLVAAMVTALEKATNRIVMPETRAGWGHPVLFGAEVVAELRSPLADGGAHHVVRRAPQRIVSVPAEARVAAELNTPAQAAALGVHVPVV